VFLGLLIGASCRWFDIPVPSPQSWGECCSLWPWPWVTCWRTKWLLPNFRRRVRLPQKPARWSDGMHDFAASFLSGGSFSRHPRLLELLKTVATIGQ